MRKIRLCCNGGMSTSLLVNKMIKAAQEQGYACEISAHSSTEIVTAAKDADIILLGPQIAYQKSKIAKMFENIKVEVIDMRAYGTMDGASVLQNVKKALGD